MKRPAPLHTDDPVAAAFLTLTSEAVVVMDEDHRIRAISRRTEELFGYASDEVAGEPLSRLLADAPEPRASDTPEEYVTRLAAMRGELSARRRGGGDFPVEATCATAETVSGRVFVFVFRDLSGRRATEAAFTRLQRARDQILESAGEGIYGLDRQGLATFVNPAAADMLGWEPDELLGKSMHAVVHHTKPDGTPYDTERCPIYAAFSDGKVHRVGDEVFWRKDGTSFPVEYVSTPIRGPGGEPAGAVVTFKDVTSRQETEDALSREQRARELILASAGEGIYGLDSGGLTTFVNPAAAGMLGWGPEELLGESQHALIHHTKSDGSVYDAKTCPIYAAFSDGQVHHVDDEVFWRKDGTSFPVAYTSTPIHDPEKGLVGAVVTFRDITERKRAEAELAQALAELERLKDRLAAENAYLKEELELEHGFEGIVGNSQALRRVLKRVEQVASTPASVLIEGETGTGKELIARAIHNLSERSERSLVRVNCAALPASLVESELFGHEKGAFTGAISRRAGRFALADGGTIFLDEVGDIPLEVQAKLLRVLQEGEFDPVGSNRTVTVDVRVVAATNRDLREAVRRGEFRADLYYRLSVFPIEIPPLRERREDILALATTFADRYGKALNRDVAEIPANVIEALLRYTWPGNVRELQNVIERAVIVTTGSKLRLEGGLEGVVTDHREHDSDALEDVERDHIVRVLQATEWRIAGRGGAAERLRMNPSTLRSRMAKLSIARSTADA